MKFIASTGKGDCENVIAVVLENPNVAVPVGTDAGDQFVAVFQSPEAGFESHVASCARTTSGTLAVTTTSAVVASSVAIRSRIGAAGRSIAADDVPVASYLVGPTRVSLNVGSFRKPT